MWLLCHCLWAAQKWRHSEPVPAVKGPILIESICPCWQICEEHHDTGKVALAVNGPFFSCDCITFQES